MKSHFAAASFYYIILKNRRAFSQVISVACSSVIPFISAIFLATSTI